MQARKILNFKNLVVNEKWDWYSHHYIEQAHSRQEQRFSMKNDVK